MMQCFCSEEEDEEDEEDEELDEEEKQRIGGIFSKVIAGHDEEDGHIEEVSFHRSYSPALKMGGGGGRGI